MYKVFVYFLKQFETKEERDGEGGGKEESESKGERERERVRSSFLNHSS